MIDPGENYFCKRKALKTLYWSEHGHFNLQVGCRLESRGICAVLLDKGTKQGANLCQVLSR